MEEKYRILFESSRDAIMLLSPPDWLFTIGNRATLEMFGAKNEKEFYSKTPGDLSPEFQPDGLLSSEKAGKMIGKAMREGSHFFEWTHMRTNSEEFPATVLLTRVEWEGRELLTATVRDTTETKKTEKELQKYRDHLEKLVEERTAKLLESEKKLQEINAAKDKFFSIISHDLRSPFNSIIGFSEILYNETDAFSKTEIKGMAESIYKTSREAFNLLNNLLEWSGTQTGRIKFEPAKTGIYDIVISTIDLLNDNAKKKNIAISVDIPEQLQVFVDLNMITTVLINLLSNAIKFTYEKGSIKISAQDTGKFVEVTVADTGVGIKPEDIKKLFQIDADFSNPGTSNEKGTGLGLILCKEFIVMNNGNIRVESEVGKGSRFIVSLPN